MLQKTNIQTKIEKTESKEVVFDLNVKNGKIPWNADQSFPYDKKMDVLEYEQHKHELQIELLRWEWVVVEPPALINNKVKHYS